MEDIKLIAEELRELIQDAKHSVAEANMAAVRLNKTIKTLWVVAGICIIPFLYSFVDIHVRTSNLEGTLANKYMPKDEIYRIFVQKVDALAVHMMEDSWKRTQLYEITHDEKYKTDLQSQQLIKAFFEEEHRGSTE
jgi:hypothetical protein